MRANISGIEVEGTPEEMGTLLRAYTNMPTAAPSKPGNKLRGCPVCGIMEGLHGPFEDERAVRAHITHMRDAPHKDYRREHYSAAESSSEPSHQVSTNDEGIPEVTFTSEPVEEPPASREMTVTETNEAIGKIEEAMRKEADKRGTGPYQVPQELRDNVLAKLYPKPDQPKKYSAQGRTSLQIAQEMGIDVKEVSRALTALWHMGKSEMAGSGSGSANYYWFRSGSA